MKETQDTMIAATTSVYDRLRHQAAPACLCVQTIADVCNACGRKFTVIERGLALSAGLVPIASEAQ